VIAATEEMTGDLTLAQVSGIRDQLIGERTEWREKLNARNDRADEIRVKIDQLKREEAVALRSDEYEVVPEADFREEIRSLEDELTRVRKAAEIAKSKVKTLDLAVQKHEGKFFDVFAAALDEEARDAKETLEEILPAYREAYATWSKVIRRQRSLVFSREVYIARGSHRLGRKSSDIPPPLEVTEERCPPDPKLLEIDPPEIIERRPTDVLGRKFIPPKRSR